MKKILLLLLLFPVFVVAQQQDVFRLDSLPPEGILLDQGWKWHAGDNTDFAQPGFDDSEWEAIDPTKGVFELPQLSKEGEISWLRLRFSLSKNPSQQVAAMVRQTGASEIYLNGKLLERFGVLTPPVEAFNPLNRPILLSIDSAGQYCLAIRYVLQPGVRYNEVYNTGNQAFLMRVAYYKQALKLVSQYDIRYTNLESYKLGIFFILFVLHFSLYFFNRNQKAHLSVAFAFLVIGVAYLFKLMGDVQNLVAWKSLFFAISAFFNNLAPLLTLQTLYLFLGQKKGIFYWLLVSLAVGLGIWVFIYPQLAWGNVSVVLSFLVTLEHFRVVIKGVKAKIRGAWILSVGVALNAFFYLVLFSFIGFFISVSPTFADVIFNLGVIAFPVALSIYLGIDSAYTNNELKQKLSEVEQLSTEKEDILATQNETLELQVAERTAEISEKNRELLVEASLDRVRARALSMQHSNEVMDVADTLYEELQKLDFKYGASTIMIMHDESNNMEHWVAGFDHLKYPESYRVNYFKNPCYDAQFEAWRNGQKYLVYTLAGEEKKAYDEQMFENNDYKKFPAKEQEWMRAGESVIFSLAFMKHGALHWGPTPLSEEKAQILQRFAAVFEQAYTRFLDLQKAEAQAREAEIELALERVRSRTMAMQHSNELGEAANLLFQQVQTLGIPAWSCGYNIWEKEEKICTGWMSSNDILQPPFRIPLTESPSFIRQYESKQKGEIFYVEEVGGEALAAHYQYMGSLPDFGEILKDFLQKGYILPSFQINHIVNFKQGNMVFITGVPVPESWDIFKRFANVFEQTYTRFLDLKQAEAQAREVQVEVALERVRSRTMSMQKSEHLVEVINVVAEQLLQLNFQLNTASFFLNNESEEFTFWLAAIGESNPDKIVIPKLTHPALDNIKEAQKNGVAFWADNLSFEEKNTWFQHVFAHSPGRVPEHRQKYIFDTKGYARSVVLMNQIGLFIVNYLPQPYTDAENAIFKRFAFAFEQAYTRFLDLQKAEEQAREAEIQLALERVRARSLAMHLSEELADLSMELVKQVQTLGIESWFCAFNIYDDDPRGSVEWGSNGQGTFPKYRTPREDVFLRYFEAGQRGETLLVNEIGEEECPAHYQYLCSLPGVGEQLLQMKADGIPFPTSQIDHVAFFKYGYVLFITYEPTPESHDIFKRFANVFEQSYTRFLDLKKAEIQAREAQIEVALERVRARAMSMQTSEEINAVIGKIFTECISLEIQLDSSIIIIYDKQTLDTKWYLTNNEDPDYPACFSVPYTEYLFNTAMLNAWYQKTIDWGYILDVQEKKEWDKFIFSKTDFVLLPDHIKEVMAAVEKLYIKASFNEFGCLMLTSLSPLNNEQMAILPRFSKVFELTYTRFNDLKIAEAQAEQAKLDLIQIQTEKKKAEDTLVELRATQAQLIQSEKLASLGELTAGIAHEIQNPLNFVNNFAEVSAEMLVEMEEELDKGDIQEAKAISADLKQNLNKINHHGKRASGIVKSMLEHSRTSSGTKEPTDLNALADEYLRLAYHGLRAKDSGFNAKYELITDPDLPKVNVVPQDMGRVLLNLISNAFYAVHEKAKLGIESYQPKVTVSTSFSENKVLISVADNGSGIPDAIKDKIFQPFFTTKPSGQGTGLGLSLAYDIVTKGHGGSMEVKTKQGECSILSIHLPIIDQY